jgi:hypothetical protein
MYTYVVSQDDLVGACSWVRVLCAPTLHLSQSSAPLHLQRIENREPADAYEEAAGRPLDSKPNISKISVVVGA